MTVVDPWLVDPWLASLVPAGVDLTASEQELVRQVIRGRHDEQIATLFEIYHQGVLSRSVATALVPRLWRDRPDGCAPEATCWLPLFRRAHYTHDFELGRRPRRRLRLFRGAVEENQQGISWTRRLDQAEYFARYRQAAGRSGKVWQARVEPFRLLAFISDEAEYVVDPAGLDITLAHRSRGRAIIRARRAGLGW